MSTSNDATSVSKFFPERNLNFTATDSIEQNKAKSRAQTKAIALQRSWRNWTGGGSGALAVSIAIAYFALDVLTAGSLTASLLIGGAIFLGLTALYKHNRVTVLQDKNTLFILTAAAEKKAAAAEKKAAAAEKKAAAAKQEADTANGRADAANGRADAANGRADAAEQEADAANGRATVAENNKQELQVQITKLNQEKMDLERKLEAATNETAQGKEAAHKEQQKLQVQLDALKNLISEKEKQCHELQESLGKLPNLLLVPLPVEPLPNPFQECFVDKASKEIQALQQLIKHLSLEKKGAEERANHRGNEALIQARKNQENTTLIEKLQSIISQKEVEISTLKMQVEKQKTGPTVFAVPEPNIDGSQGMAIEQALSVPLNNGYAILGDTVNEIKDGMTPSYDTLFQTVGLVAFLFCYHQKMANMGQVSAKYVSDSLSLIGALAMRFLNGAGRFCSDSKKLIGEIITRYPDAPFKALLYPYMVIVRAKQKVANEIGSGAADLAAVVNYFVPSKKTVSDYSNVFVKMCKELPPILGEVAGVLKQEIQRGIYDSILLNHKELEAAGNNGQKLWDFIGQQAEKYGLVAVMNAIQQDMIDGLHWTIDNGGQLMISSIVNVGNMKSGSEELSGQLMISSIVNVGNMKSGSEELIRFGVQAMGNMAAKYTKLEDFLSDEVALKGLVWQMGQALNKNKAVVAPESKGIVEAATGVDGSLLRDHLIQQFLGAIFQPQLPNIEINLNQWANFVAIGLVANTEATIKFLKDNAVQIGNALEKRGVTNKNLGKLLAKNQPDNGAQTQLSSTIALASLTKRAKELGDILNIVPMLRLLKQIQTVKAWKRNHA